MGLGKWEWERVLELGICRTDDEILKRKTLRGLII